MKLRNTRDQMVRIRLPKHRINLEIMPLAVIEVDMKTRQALLPYMQDFGLTLEADNEDFQPNAILPENKVSNEKELPDGYYKKPYIEGKNDAEPTDEEMEDLLFPKGTEETGQTETESNGDTSESTPGDDGDSDGDEFEPIGPADEDQEEGDGETAVIEPVGLEGTEEDLRTEEEQLEEELTGVPEACPYALTELQTKTKSELWEICEGLGLDASGTKKVLIERIVNFYRHM